MKIADSEHDGYHKKKSDLDCVRSLLEQSGIAVDASEIAEKKKAEREKMKKRKR
ncbi:hypothetical protein ACS0TY_033228 [Phlomoides rotata]